MGTLMIKCPKTGREISTGIRMDRSTFQNMPVFFTRTLCPICETQHEWFAGAVWIQEPKDRGEQPIDPARINRRRPARNQPKWIVVAAIFAAAAVAAGFVAGTAAVDASPFSNSAIRNDGSSTVVAKSSTDATAFPVANRAAKANRLRVLIPDNEAGAAIEQTATDRDSRSVHSRAVREGERKLAAHCEPVASPLAGRAILFMLPRRCFARLGPLPHYTLVDSIALRAT